MGRTPTSPASTLQSTTSDAAPAAVLDAQLGVSHAEYAARMRSARVLAALDAEFYEPGGGR